MSWLTNLFKGAERWLVKQVDIDFDANEQMIVITIHPTFGDKQIKIPLVTLVIFIAKRIPWAFVLKAVEQAIAAGLLRRDEVAELTSAKRVSVA